MKVLTILRLEELNECLINEKAPKNSGPSLEFEPAFPPLLYSGFQPRRWTKRNFPHDLLLNKTSFVLCILRSFISSLTMDIF